nr:EOG090X0QLW [Polyphemus pediculus]
MIRRPPRSTRSEFYSPTILFNGDGQLVVLGIGLNSAVETSASKSGAHKLKALDDLYIDDDGDDDIQLQDQASGAGPIKNTQIVDEEDEEEEEEEEEEDLTSPDDVDEEEESVVPAPSVKAKVEAVSNRNQDKEEVVPPPRVSPVAAPPYSAPASSKDDEDDEDDFQGSGSGAGGISPDDDDEEDYDDADNEEVDSIDLSSVVGETEPKVVITTERKPEVAPTPPPKAPKEMPTVSGRDENQIPMGGSTTPPGPVNPGQGSDGNRANNDVHILDHKPDDRQASFFAQPGILAAVIGGAVVGLLCAILLVMFIVYRMRKKDEGSYVLDEPKRNSPNSHPYNKFYA